MQISGHISHPNLLIRLALPVTLTILLFVLAIYFLVFPAFEKHYMEQKREMIREVTGSALNIIRMFHEREKAGLMTREAAQVQAARQIRMFRYGPEGKDYFWINDMRPRMVMHPYRPDLEGTDISGFTDPNGKRPFEAVVDVVRRHADGYVDYMWQWKDDPGKTVPKLSFVKGFGPWEWIVGSGIYIDDVQADMARIRKRFSFIVAAILLIVSPLIFYIVQQIIYADRTRRQADAALKDSEALMRTVIRSIPDLVWLKDQNGVYLACNSRFERFFGAKEEDIIGKTDYNFLDRELAEFFRKHDKAAMAKGGPSKNEEEVTYADDGHREVLETIKTPLYTSDRRLSGVLGIGRDITERKRAEEERERLMSAIEQSSETVMITDTEGTIQYVNPAFERVTGYARGEVLGRNPKILKSGEQADAFYRDMWESIRGGRTWQGHIVNRRKDGRLFTEDVSISPVVDAQGSIVNYVAVKRDITEHLRMEREKNQLEEQYHQAQKVESIGRLAGGVAHDLNNLLTPILGYGEILLDDVKEEDFRKNCVEQIVQAGYSARDLVRQLLAFSRKQPLAYKPVDMNDTVTGFEKLMRRTIREDIEFEIVLSPDMRIVMADIGQIEQVIMNLVVNAADAMPEGGRLSIETALTHLDRHYAATHRDVQPGAYVMLAVSDTGCGMDEEVRARIFEPFFSTKGRQGTGLGLSTVYGIVKQHGGSIWVYSEPGGGTTFKIYLPVAEAPRVEITVSAKSDGHAMGSETILLAEDNKQVRQIGFAILRQLGFKVLSAESGFEALALLATYDGPLHLLLTDVIMPGMNGKELYTRVAAKYPGLKVLYMSGYTDNVIAHQGVLDEGVQFIQKPFTAHSLATRIREVLGRES